MLNVGLTKASDPLMISVGMMPKEKIEATGAGASDPPLGGGAKGLLSKLPLEPGIGNGLLGLGLFGSMLGAVLAFPLGVPGTWKGSMLGSGIGGPPGGLVGLGPPGGLVGLGPPGG